MKRLLAYLATLSVTVAVDQPVLAQANAPATTDPELTELLHYEPTGLSLLRPHVRGKVPVVLVHGLWSNPCSWRRMIEALETDPNIKEGYNQKSTGR
jgi:hypothetical protein